MAEQQQGRPTTPREVMLADLRQRATWRQESADEYFRHDNLRAYEWFAGQAAGFAAAARIIEMYHPGIGSGN